MCGTRPPNQKDKILCGLGNNWKVIEDCDQSEFDSRPERISGTSDFSPGIKSGEVVTTGQGHYMELSLVYCVIFLRAFLTSSEFFERNKYGQKII